MGLSVGEIGEIGAGRRPTAGRLSTRRDPLDGDQWPEPARPQRFRLDFGVTDLDRAKEQVLAGLARAVPRTKRDPVSAERRPT